ncbi:MAG: response regulator [Dehalococcoidia bacterium]
MGSPVRILVVEDEPALRLLMAATLSDEGHEVSLAEDGRRALKVVESQPAPDAVILDLEMPVMDGRTCFRELRSRGVTAPVVIVSAFGARRAAEELGADGSVDKPFEASELIHHLNVVLS